MAKYLVKVNYTADGTKGLLKDGGTGRRAVVTKATEALGGKVEAFYFALGSTDAFLILDAPDVTSAAALSMAVNSTGAVRIELTPLLTCEEVDAAAHKTVSYTKPGA